MGVRQTQRFGTEPHSARRSVGESQPGTPGRVLLPGHRMPDLGTEDSDVTFDHGTILHRLGGAIQPVTLIVAIRAMAAK